MNIRRLLLIHAIIVLVAGVVLVAAPAAIPGTVDMPLVRGQYLLCYFLAAGELAMAFLSFAGRRSGEGAVLRLVSKTLMVFHAATALLELYAWARGETTNGILANVALRLVIVALLGYYGLYKTRSETGH